MRAPTMNNNVFLPTEQTDKSKFEIQIRDPIGRFAPSRMTDLKFIFTLSFWSEAIESRLNAI